MLQGRRPVDRELLLERGVWVRVMAREMSIFILRFWPEYWFRHFQDGFGVWDDGYELSPITKLSLGYR